MALGTMAFRSVPSGAVDDLTRLAAACAAAGGGGASRRSLAVRTSTGRTGSRSRVRWSIRALRCLRSLAFWTSASLIGQGATHTAQRAGSSTAHCAMSR